MIKKEEIDQKQARSEIKTIPVPFALEEIKGNISITLNTPSKPYKEQIINQAFKFHSQGNITEAAKYYQLFINQGFKDHRVFSNYGIVLRDLGKLKEAEITIRNAIELNPNFADAYSNLGNILQDLGNLKDAESSQRKAIELQPDFAEAYNNLGTIFKSLGNLKEAEIFFSKALALKPDFTLALMNRGQLFFDKNEFDKALYDSDACNTKESRAFSLETLYALERTGEIYQRIKKTAKLDEKNIRLAAFSSFISEREKKDTANNFCRNPLSLLHISNLKLHVQDYKKFIKEIIHELAYIEPIWEPPKKATHNGFQTPKHINLFKNSPQAISYLKSIILKELDSYYLKYEKESCSYIQKWPCNKNLFAWYVILKKQGYQEAHIHTSGWLSGVIYLKVVPPLDKDEGAIELSLNGANYSDINSPQLTHQPNLGDILLFPSSLHHRTIPFSTDTERIVLAFDLKPS